MSDQYTGLSIHEIASTSIPTSSGAQETLQSPTPQPSSTSFSRNEGKDLTALSFIEDGETADITILRDQIRRLKSELADINAKEKKLLGSSTHLSQDISQSMPSNFFGFHSSELAILGRNTWDVDAQLSLIVDQARKSGIDTSKFISFGGSQSLDIPEQFPLDDAYSPKLDDSLGHLTARSISNDDIPGDTRRSPFSDHHSSTFLEERVSHDGATTEVDVELIDAVMNPQSSHVCRQDSLLDKLRQKIRKRKGIDEKETEIDDSEKQKSFEIIEEEEEINMDCEDTQSEEETPSDLIDHPSDLIDHPSDLIDHPNPVQQSHSAEIISNGRVEANQGSLENQQKGKETAISSKLATSPSDEKQEEEEEEEEEEGSYEYVSSVDEEEERKRKEEEEEAERKRKEEEEERKRKEEEERKRKEEEEEKKRKAEEERKRKEEEEERKRKEEEERKKREEEKRKIMKKCDETVFKVLKFTKDGSKAQERIVRVSTQTKLLKWGKSESKMTGSLSCPSSSSPKPCFYSSPETYIQSLPAKKQKNFRSLVEKNPKMHFVHVIGA
ncbi:hypothetical protein ADUPG1_011501, partial [Aduncisulcus paluster]